MFSGCAIHTIVHTQQETSGRVGGVAMVVLVASLFTIFKIRAQSQIEPRCPVPPVVS